MRVFTLDRVPLGEAEWLDSGALRAPARIGRVGVQQYEIDGRVVGVLRPPEEVFKPESMRSFDMLPVTNGHPSEFVNVQNAKSLTIGTTAHVEQDSQDQNYMRSMITIWDHEGLAAYKAGRKEISNGYYANREPAPPGSIYKDPITGREEPYEFIQRNITGNHVALVDAGRAGPGARIFADSAKGNGDQLPIMVSINDDRNSPQETRKEAMENIVIDGVTFQVSTQVSQAWAKTNTAHADALKKLTADADTVRGERDALKGEVASLNEKLKIATDPKEIEKKIQDRLTISELAKSHGIADASNMTLSAVQRAVVTKLSPNTPIKDQSDEYVAGVFATLTAKAGGVGQSIGSAPVTTDSMPNGKSAAQTFRDHFFNQGKK